IRLHLIERAYDHVIEKLTVAPHPHAHRFPGLDLDVAGHETHAMLHLHLQRAVHDCARGRGGGLITTAKMQVVVKSCHGDRHRPPFAHASARAAPQSSPGGASAGWNRRHKTSGETLCRKPVFYQGESRLAEVARK